MGREIIIQPHSDDALFCCYSILSRHKNVEVITVENDPKRIAEDDRLYDVLEVPHSHLNTSYKDESYYAYFPKQKKGEPRVPRRKVELESSIQCLQEHFGAEGYESLQSEIKRLSNAVDNEENTIYLPAGIGHPSHLVIRHLFESAIEHAKVIYYRDFPHSYRRSSIEQLEEFKLECPYHEEFQLTEEDHNLKWWLAGKFYRSQSGLMFYEQGHIQKNVPEEFYSREEFNGSKRWRKEELTKRS